MSNLNQNIVEAEFFIIPNRTSPIEADSLVLKYQNRKNVRFDVDERFHLQIGDIPVQIWATDGKCDNLQCHYSDNWRDGYCPVDNIPARLLEGMVEGDTIDVSLNNYLGERVILRLTAKQLDYRYKNFGRFEDVLLRVA